MNDHDLLTRIDERVQHIADRLDTFVTQDEFRPWKKTLWAVIAFIASMAVAALPMIMRVLK